MSIFKSIRGLRQPISKVRALRGEYQGKIAQWKSREESLFLKIGIGSLIFKSPPLIDMSLSKIPPLSTQRPVPPLFPKSVTTE